MHYYKHAHTHHAVSFIQFYYKHIRGNFSQLYYKHTHHAVSLSSFTINTRAVILFSFTFSGIIISTKAMFRALKVFILPESHLVPRYPGLHPWLQDPVLASHVPSPSQCWPQTCAHLSPYLPASHADNERIELGN